MIQRFCFVKLRDAEIATRGALAAQLSAELRAAGADAVVGLPADASAVRWDLSLVITTASLEAWHALSVLPAIAAALDELAGRATVVKAWTFEAVAC
ncbi:MAG: hypothetical protein ABIY55_33740 [Kofleriaceae bacterium]